MSKKSAKVIAVSHSGDVLTPEQRRRCMQANKSKGTKPELAMGRLLWSCGIRYRKHPRDIAGTPDFCIRKYKLAIFVDGEFWHGRDWEHKKASLRSNRDFWVAKIERNIRRDRRVDAELTRRGWTVLRFWESDIRRNTGICLRRVLEHINHCNRETGPDYIPADYADILSCESTEISHSLPMAAEDETLYGSLDNN